MTTTRGVGGCLFCLKVKDDASYVATTNADCVQIWDPKTGNLLRSLSEHSEIVTSLLWLRTPTQPSFFTSSLDKTIKLWRDFKPVSTLKEHADWIRCLGLSQGDKTLLSGCVSSVITGWDVETEKPIFKIPNAHQHSDCPELNTINSLNFANQNDNIFISGARDGFVKIWDKRALSKVALSGIAHSAKVNHVQFSSNDALVLSGGRDSTIRLWDVRVFSESPPANVMSTGLIREYKSHHCSGYNVACSFFDDERHIVSGSEDKKVYIYETSTGNVVKILEGHPSIVHLVHSVPSNPCVLYSSSIENCMICVWSPDQSNRVELPAIAEPSQESILHSSHRAAIEALMQKHGDKIMKLFHQHNFTFSSGLSDWQSVISGIAADPAQHDLLRVINELATDFSRALRLLQTQLNAQNPANSVPPHDDDDDPDDDDDASDEDDVEADNDESLTWHL